MYENTENILVLCRKVPMCLLKIRSYKLSNALKNTKIQRMKIVEPPSNIIDDDESSIYSVVTSTSSTDVNILE